MRSKYLKIVAPAVVVALLFFILVSSFKARENRSWEWDDHVNSSVIGEIGLASDPSITQNEVGVNRSLEPESSEIEAPASIQMVAASPSVSNVARAWVVRQRALENGDVTFNQERLSVELFDGEKADIELDSQEMNQRNRLVMVGKIKRAVETFPGEGLLVIDEHEHSYSGRIVMPDGTLYVIAHEPNGDSVLQEVDSQKFPACGAEVEGNDPPENKQAITPRKIQQHLLAADVDADERPDLEVSSDSPMANTTITVLVAYTAEARADVGGTSAMETLIDSAIAISNTAYSNSGINLTLSLVHSVEVSYTETGSFNLELMRLSNGSDGEMDDLFTLRDDYEADVVTLLVKSTQYCGLAYMMGPSDLRPEFGEYGAFSVLHHGCAGGNISMAHEIGHNMGANHDPANASGSGAFSYSLGHNFGSWRTVMAYLPGTRVAYFSNPDVNYDSIATGSDLYNNALTLRQTMGLVASFRGTTPTYTLSGLVEANGDPMQGVVVSAGSHGSDTTGSDGKYTISGLVVGDSYTLTPSKSGYTFDPTTASGTVYGNTTQNFVASLPTASIAGVVTLGSDALQGVSVDGGGLGTTTTDSLGQFSFADVTIGSSYSLSYAKEGYSFSPQTSSGTMGSSLSLEISATALSYEISGTVTKCDAGAVSGVTVDGGALGAVFTNSKGGFSYANVATGTSYEIIPTLPGYYSSPVRVSGVVSKDVTVEFCLTQDPGLADNDGDGLTNQEEGELGTNPDVADSDGDGVSDGQEHVDGSDPLDSGSVLAQLGNTVCSEWNGFLGGMLNILEHVNMSNNVLRVESKLYDIEGTLKDTMNFTIQPGTQFDVLVHDMEGRDADTVGLVCSSHDGASGDLDGRMIYYKYDFSNLPFMEFAFAMPFQQARTGEQFVPFNTYQPSLDSSDSQNLVANWIQVSNLSDVAGDGVLYFYGMDGAELGSNKVSLPAGARADIAGHQFGSSLVGLVRWVPKDSSSQFQLRNVRYLYNNSGLTSTFDTAFQLEGTVGSGEKLVAPLVGSSGSAIVEISNVLNEKIEVELKLYSAAGVLLDSKNLALKSRSTYHYIADSYLAGQLGVVSLQGSKKSSVLATVMQYGRDESAGIKFMYGIKAKETLGSVLRSSYNSYLGQSCSLLLVNSTNDQQTAMLSMVRSDGTVVVDSQSVEVAGNGITDVNLCSYDPSDAYGVVTIQVEPNVISGSVVRIGAEDTYRFPTPLRQ